MPSPECAARSSGRRAGIDFWSDRSGSPAIIFAMRRAAGDPACGLCRRLCAADAERRDASNPPPIRSRWRDAHPTTSTTANSLRTPAQTMFSAYAQTNAAIARHADSVNNNSVCLSATQPHSEHAVVEDALRGTPTVRRPVAAARRAAARSRSRSSWIRRFDGDCEARPSYTGRSRRQTRSPSSMCRARRRWRPSRSCRSRPR